MRNQLESAGRIGVKARTINSTNNGEWEDIQRELSADQVDVLLISPERLANNDFRQNILTSMVNNIGLFAVDEAHCISIGAMISGRIIAALCVCCRLYLLMYRFWQQQQRQMIES